MNTTRPKSTTEPEYRYVMSGPEIEVIEIIRLAHTQPFSMAIEHRDGVFAVRLTDTTAGKYIEGCGASFEGAWRSLHAADLGELTISERIAARGTPTDSNLRIVETQR